MKTKNHSDKQDQTCEDLVRELREVIADKDIIIDARDNEIRFLKHAFQDLMEKVEGWQNDHSVQAKRLLKKPQDSNESNNNE